MKNLSVAEWTALINQMIINVTALVGAATALVVTLRTRSRVLVARAELSKNTDRIHSLENGGGDRKIDARLATHGLLERRSDSPVTVSDSPVTRSDSPVTRSDSTPGV